MKWINIYILGVFHFSPPLAYGPALVKSGPMFSLLLQAKRLIYLEGGGVSLTI